MAIGMRTMDPDAPDGEKPLPVPLQAVALALVQVSVDDLGYHIEVGDAEKVTVGAPGLACALELTTCRVINNGETSKPSLIADTEFRNMCGHLNWLELVLTDDVREGASSTLGGFGQAAIDFHVLCHGTIAAASPLR